MVPRALVCKTIWSHETKVFWGKTTYKQAL